MNLAFAIVLLIIFIAGIPMLLMFLIKWIGEGIWGLFFGTSNKAGFMLTESPAIKKSTKLSETVSRQIGEILKSQKFE